jgi:hypothetical protein
MPAGVTGKLHPGSRRGGVRGRRAICRERHQPTGVSSARRRGLLRSAARPRPKKLPATAKRRWEDVVGHVAQGTGVPGARALRLPVWCCGVSACAPDGSLEQGGCGSGARSSKYSDRSRGWSRGASGIGRLRTPRRSHAAPEHPQSAVSVVAPVRTAGASAKPAMVRSSYRPLRRPATSPRPPRCRTERAPSHDHTADRRASQKGPRAGQERAGSEPAGRSGDCRMDTSVRNRGTRPHEGWGRFRWLSQARDQVDRLRINASPRCDLFLLSGAVPASQWPRSTAVNHSARVVGIGHTAQKVPLVTPVAPRERPERPVAGGRTLRG